MKFSGGERHEKITYSFINYSHDTKEEYKYQNRKDDMGYKPAFPFQRRA